MSTDLPPGAETPEEIADEASAPACILTFNASDASGAAKASGSGSGNGSLAGSIG